MGNNIKLFLGQRPAKVLTPDNISEKDRGILQGVNTYLLTDKTWMALSVPELGISRLSFFRLTNPILLFDKDKTYVPIKISLHMGLYNEAKKSLSSAMYSPSDVFYITGIGARPNAEHLFKHLKKALAAPFIGSIDLQLARYAILLSNAKTTFLQTLLYLATSGKGDIIDYSWIAPLQNLLELREDEEKRVIKKTLKSWVSEEEEDLGIDYLPPDLVEHTFNVKLAERLRGRTGKAHSELQGIGRIQAELTNRGSRKQPVPKDVGIPDPLA